MSAKACCSRIRVGFRFVVLTLGGGIVFAPIATALTVVELRRTRPETLVDFGALLVGAASPATRSCGLLGSPVTRCCSQPDVGGSERISPAPVLLLICGGAGGQAGDICWTFLLGSVLVCAGAQPYLGARLVSGDEM